jgi:hypothetical protein
MEGLDLMRCQGERPELHDQDGAYAGHYIQYYPCEEDATRRVLASTMPGRADGRLLWLYLCEACYQREGWADSKAAADLAGERDVWELSTGTNPDA